MPLTRRLPKRGFYNRFGKNVVIVNVAQLNLFPKDSVVDADSLLKKGIVKSVGDEIKILGKGKIDYPLTVRVNKLSASARQKIEASGGMVEFVS